MAGVSTTVFRTSTQLQSQVMLNALRRTNVALLESQEQLSTGRRLNRPSDAPGDAGQVVDLRRLLNAFDLQTENLTQARTTLDGTDQAMSDINDILLEAHAVASSQIGVGSNAETRTNQAEVINAQLASLMAIVNREYNDVYLFAGRRSSEQPFVEKFGGVKYLGNEDYLTFDLGGLEELGVNSNGIEALGGLSTRVKGSVDLDLQLTTRTRLADISGATNRGVIKGSIRLRIDGTNVVDVDLSDADTVGDVATRINHAITNLVPGAGAMSLAGDHLRLTANAGFTIEIEEIGTNSTAQSMGIELTADASASGVPISSDGAGLDAKLTELSSLAALGTSVDLAAGAGLRISNGTSTADIDLSGATTVQDLMNRVAAADLGVRLVINADQTGLDLVNEVSGTLMSIGEIPGHTTANDLGLRTMSRATQLDDLNLGMGVRRVEAKTDIEVVLSDGTSGQVNLDDVTTIAELETAINSVLGAGAVTIGPDPNGFGVVVQDNSGGAGSFTIRGVNDSFAAEDLGIKQTVAGNTIVSENVGQVRTESVFTHLMMLRDALLDNDSRMITIAGEKIYQDTQRATAARAAVGVRSQRAEQARLRTEEMKIQSQEILSGIEDVDYAEVITRFTQLQQQLQANLAAGSSQLQLSLLDFLR